MRMWVAIRFAIEWKPLRGIFNLWPARVFVKYNPSQSVSQLPRRGYRSIAYLRTVINPIFRREFRSIIFTITNIFRRIGIIMERKPLRGMQMWLQYDLAIERKPLRGMQMWVVIRFGYWTETPTGYANVGCNTIWLLNGNPYGVCKCGL